MKKILVVEDDMMLSDLIKTNFVRNGHEVYQAEDSAKAIDVLAKEPIDIMLLDYDLKDGDKSDKVLNWLKTNESKPKIYCISGSIERYQLLNEIIPCEYTPKPFSLETLLQIAF